MSSISTLPVKREYDEAALLRVMHEIEIGPWPVAYNRPRETPEYLGRHRAGDVRLGLVLR